jgi:signal transduction histidine kinase
MSAPQDTSFARLVSLACHDLRTPLATVHGFARTIQRSSHELSDPLPRYLEMITVAAEQMTALLETVSLAARIEAGRYDPVAVEADTRALAEAAAARVDGTRVEGEGATIETDREALTSALVAFASCARRHGAVPEVTLHVAGREISIEPLGDAGPVILGNDMKDLGAAVAVRAVRALGGSAEIDGDALRVRV